MDVLALQLVGLYFLGATLPAVLLNRPISKSAIIQFCFAVILLALSLAIHYGLLR